MTGYDQGLGLFDSVPVIPTTRRERLSRWIRHQRFRFWRRWWLLRVRVVGTLRRRITRRWRRLCLEVRYAELDQQGGQRDQPKSVVDPLLETILPRPDLN